MNLVIFGASGGVGRLLVEQGLAEGHKIKAFIRNPAALPLEHKNLNIIQGNVFDLAKVETAINGQDVVLSALGPKVKFRQKTTIYSHSASNIVTAMEKLGVRRLLWITSGAVDTQDLLATGFLYSKIITPLFFEGVYFDALKSEAILRGSNLDWVIARPAQLTNGPLTATYRIGLPHVPTKGKKISRADLADFLLKQLTNNSYVHKTPAIAY